MDRRFFLKLAGAACGSTLVGAPSNAAETANSATPLVSVLTDLSVCNGCRKCEEACAEANGLPMPDIKDKSVFDRYRTRDSSQYTIVNRYHTEKGDIFVKTQCMHCNQPGCASACLVRAMDKTKEGPVIWHEDRCMGCRYCMVSCPFNVPRFEYHSANPRIRKCTLCQGRLAEGKLPACVKACPVEALLFGTRQEMIDIARSRVYGGPPGKYVSHIYGEHEVGGTSWLYISPVPFEEVGFETDLGSTPYPEYTKGFLYSVPIILLLWPAFLYGASRTRSMKNEEAEEEPAVRGEEG